MAITFKAGSRNGASIAVNIPVLDDSIQESTEGFIIVLDVNTSLTWSSQVAFTRNLRTALVKIIDNDRKLNLETKNIYLHIITILHTAFFFGFTQMEYTYNERRSEGVNFIPFRAAPGNVTEKMFTFHLNLNSVSSTFTFGGLLY